MNFRVILPIVPELHISTSLEPLKNTVGTFHFLKSLENVVRIDIFSVLSFSFWKHDVFLHLYTSWDPEHKQEIEFC